MLDCRCPCRAGADRGDNMNRTLALVAAAFVALSAAPAAAQSRVEAGLLECLGSETVGLVVGSITEFNCIYRPKTAPQQLYKGVVRRIGIDIGFTRHTVLNWAVLAPTDQIGLGDLSGNYAGISAGGSAGVGVGANALIGGSSNSIALQPLSVQGQSGINLAAGVASLELSPR